MSKARFLFAFLLTAALLPTGPASRAADEADPLRDKVQGLNNITGTDPIAGEIKALLAKPADAKKLVKLAAEMSKEKDSPVGYNAAFILARTGHGLKEYEASETLYKLCVDKALKLQSGQKTGQAFLGLMDLFTETKKHDETVKICRQFLEMKADDTLNRMKPVVLEVMIQALARQGKVDEALKLVNNLAAAAEGEEDGWYIQQLKGSVQREGGQYAEAAKTYESVLDLLRKDKAMKKEQRDRALQRYRYILSGIYVDIDQVDKAADHLKALLKEQPDNPTFNNDLGYIWADHDKNLEEAEKLVRKALDEDRKQRKADPEARPEDDKDNAAYLDSMGWVLFKKKDFAGARKYLEQAVKDPDGQHIEIFDHLGDVLAALKDKDGALAAYKKGLESVGTTKREQQKKAVVEKKVKDLEGK